ncbi:protein MCM10 homolog isoform X2 [Nerophis lumbriciformis]|uniref:protein MCM10 homolog isoform X2 n=1 Tax=Nerophis lumbriciformis TaxID=546530 RepID=UPI002ADF5DF4|nr:protein MCM10 homolog isoform X2 [Nerophis lumbriciformis]XP_061815101.1 protein MCM10 homolog isoform X2 [Nerophis lumbriciformis]XP_061815102.1 protein MCM10 homolog isoform X2 [Nerophis lumbriciformis]
MDCEDDLDILTALMVENEDQQASDDLDGLFDNDGEGGFEEGQDAEEDELSELFRDVEEEEGATESIRQASESLNRSQEDLQDELRRMQEKMQALQKQLEASQTPRSSSSAKPTAAIKPSPSRLATPKRSPERPAAVAQKNKNPSVSSGSQKMQESSDFLSQLSNADSFKRKPRLAHTAKSNPSPESRGPLMEIKMGSSFQPVESTSKPAPVQRSPPSSQSRPSPPASAGLPKLDSLSKDVAVEKYSGLRLRKPRVSSAEMDRKMADRRLIRLSQVPERLLREKLEDSDWVTFAVVVSKATPQSSSSGKTFSIWKLNDLHNLDVFVSLLLFGDVHKEHWKTETGTVIGLLNPNTMKQKDGYDGVSLTVDHPQKVLLMGEAQDYGTCKAMKKNGDPCSQLVNMYECQYCQYHVKAQYKKMSSKRAELQSSFSGKAPNKVKGASLKERLCQDGFYYGGVSSAACAASLSAPKPNKPGQKTLDRFFVKGSARQAKTLGMQSGEVSGCSSEFRSLMSAPTPGALQLKKHLAPAAVSKDPHGSPIQSISASDLLKQQKQKQRELLENRRRRVEGLQASVLPKSRDSLLTSPKAAPVVPKTSQSPATPTLGRGLCKGEDVLFFDSGPPAAPANSLSATKMAALRKLRAKGMALEKEDPNGVKRKRTNSNEINTRVEQSLTSPNAESSGSDEPALKKKQEQLSYIHSEEFQKILNAKSRHGAVLEAAEYQLQERYFDVLVKKEQMEDKMRNIREMKCRAVSCKECKYTYFKPADRCVADNHPLHWHDAKKRFFKCPCGQRAIALDRLPHKHCSNCGLFKWERDGMLKEKKGPKIGGELLLPRGEEHGKFLNSLK